MKSRFGEELSPEGRQEDDEMISTRLHGILDYILGAVLVFLPWVLGFARGGVETWLPVTLGAVVVLYSLLTDYELGAIKLLSMPSHLTLDGIAGGFLALSPWLLRYDEFVWGPHMLLGLVLLIAALFTQRLPTRPTPLP